MSKRILNAVLYNSNAGRTLAVRMILVILAERADDSGYCYPSPEYLAEMSTGQTSFHVSTVRKALNTLCQDGEIIRWKWRPKAPRRRKNEYLVVIGLTDNEIRQSLIKMNQTLEQVELTLEGLANGESQFFLRKNGPLAQKTGERPKQKRRETHKNERETPKTSERHADPSEIRQLDPSVLDPSERGDSLSVSLKTIKQQPKLHDLTANGSEPPPNSAPPPRADFNQIYEAVGKVLDKKHLSSRDKVAARNLYKAGYSAQQIELLAPKGTWFSQAKPFGASNNPLHRSQLMDFIDQCLAWHQSSSVENAKASEYTFDDYSLEELEAIRQDVAAEQIEATSEVEALPPSEVISVDELEELRRRLGIS